MVGHLESMVIFARMSPVVLWCVMRLSVRLDEDVYTAALAPENARLGRLHTAGIFAG
jgi:hypothetical protein